jgi:3-hydroxyisobutyrate dehydrogenase-like beta-hydroxyacid dehydrogenase
MAKVAWIGLGVMGYPMAGYLLTKGDHELAVYNRNGAKAQAWLAAYASGNAHPTPAEAAKNADFVFACVGNDDDLRQVTTGPEGAFTTMRPGAIFIDHTTASADIARELHAAAANKGLAFVDAPVSGGQAGAEAGQLTVMCGGDEEACSAAAPLIRSYAKAVRRMGPAGSGQLAKMVNQIAIAGLLQGLSEAIAFAENAGLDVAAVIDTISKGAAQSWQMENRWKSMHERRFDFGFAVDWMRKDLGICLAEASRNGSKLSVTELVDQYYSDVQKLGGQRWDTSSLIARLPSPTATK